MLYLLLGLLLLVIGLVVVVLIIVGVIASPAFRIAAIVVAGLLIWALNSAREEAKQNALQRVAADKFAVSAIKPSDLKIEDVKLSGDEPSYVLDGVVTNMSTFMLAGIYFEISMTDCKNTECRVVGQAQTSAIVYVPAGQTRAFHSDRMLFTNLPQLSGGNRTWEYKVTTLRASQK